MLNIALNTFKEIIRNKFLYLIIFFAVLFIIFSVALSKLAIWDEEKIIIDFWLAMIEFFGILSVIFVWSQLLFKEVEWKTIFLILSKPIKRYEFILWKFLWFSLVISIIVLLQSSIYLIILLSKSIILDYLIITSLIFIFLKLIALLAMVLFLSTFMSNILTIIMSLLVYMISHSFSLVLDMVSKIWNEIMYKFIQILQLFFPPFEAMNIKDYIWSFTEFSSQYLLLNWLYSLIYIWLLLFFSILIFSRKKFEN